MNVSRLLGLGCVGFVLIACGGGVSLGDASQGIKNGGTDAGGTGTGIKKDCSLADACGPQLGMPAEQCSDGSIGGNTGQCLSTADGSCAWEIRSCPANGGACFDATGELDGSLRTCNTTADCVSVKIQRDCCGTFRVVGVNKASEAQAQKCGDDRTSGFPQCGCANQGTFADDGTNGFDFTQVTVSCSAAKVCTTTIDPCAGQTLPACERECDTFPETGACTAGDKCRLKGSKIGDDCVCNAGTWACAVHPPLGMGCNLVCK